MTHRNCQNHWGKLVALFLMSGLTGCNSLSGKPDNTLANPRNTGDLACQAWESLAGGARKRIPLVTRTEGQNDYLVGATANDLIRYIATVSNGQISLAMSHRQKDLSVSHTFKPTDSNLSLSLSAGSQRGTPPPDTYELSCLIKSEIP